MPFRYGIDFLYTTTTLGVDPGYSSQSFYSSILDKDTARVNSRFGRAAENGVRIEQRSCDLPEILAHLARHGPCIVLTNANVIACDGSHHISNSLLCGGKSGGSGGSSARYKVLHYISVVNTIKRKTLFHTVAGQNAAEAATRATTSSSSATTSPPARSSTAIPA